MNIARKHYLKDYGPNIPNLAKISRSAVSHIDKKQREKAPNLLSNCKRLVTVAMLRSYNTKSYGYSFVVFKSIGPTANHYLSPMLLQPIDSMAHWSYYTWSYCTLIFSMHIKLMGHRTDGMSFHCLLQDQWARGLMACRVQGSPKISGLMNYQLSKSIS